MFLKEIVLNSFQRQQKGFAPLLLLIALAGILGFVFMANSAPFKNSLLTSLFPKNSSFAASPFNPGDTDGDLDVDIFDYNNLLTNFGKVFNNADFDGNNKIDIFDYNILLTNFGKKYPPNPPSPSPTSSSSTSWHPCGVSEDVWHGDDINGCKPGHTHFEPPPAWVQNSGWPLHFSTNFPVDSNENAQGPDSATPNRMGKHYAMKTVGFRTDAGEDVYIRFHASTNVHNRMVRFHSFEVWVKDISQNISHAQGWLNSGVPTRIGRGTAGGGGRRETCNFDTGIRPEIEVVFTMDQFINCNNNEFWYQYPMNTWFPLIFLELHATTFTYPDELNELSFTNWRPTGALGIIPQTTINWSASINPLNPPSANPKHNQKFWSTQFGETVSGPNDPRCSQTTVFNANPTAGLHPFDQTETYQNICLEQYIASTLGFVSYNWNGKQFSDQGIKLPN